MNMNQVNKAANQDILAVRRVKEQLIKAERIFLQNKKFNDLMNWISENRLKSCDYSFTSVKCHTNGLERHYHFEILFQYTFRVKVTYSQFFPNDTFHMLMVENQISPRKNRRAETHRLVLLNAIGKDPLRAYAVARSNEDLLNDVDIEELIKDRLYNI